MKTEQEKYYERKNKEAEEWGQLMVLIFPLLLLFCFGWVLIWAWPFVLFCAIVYIIVTIVKNIKNVTIESSKTVYNFIFRRKEITKDLLDLLDSFAILMMIFFGIVLAISITIK